MSNFVRCAVLALLCFAVLGCAGDATVTPSRFTGVFEGTWVNVADNTDRGTSVWTIDSTGNVRGEDFEPSSETSYELVGRIDANGNLVATSTPDDGSGPAPLNGPMTFNEGWLTGQLQWAGENPPLTYQYTLTRKQH